MVKKLLKMDAKFYLCISIHALQVFTFYVYYTFFHFTVRFFCFGAHTILISLGFALANTLAVLHKHCNSYSLQKSQELYMFE